MTDVAGTPVLHVDIGLEVFKTQPPDLSCDRLEVSLKGGLSIEEMTHFLLKSKSYRLCTLQGRRERSCRKGLSTQSASSLLTNGR